MLHGNLNFANILSRVGDERPAPVHAAGQSNSAPGATSQMDESHETVDPGFGANEKSPKETQLV